MLKLVHDADAAPPPRAERPLFALPCAFLLSAVLWAAIITAVRLALG